MFLLLTFFSQIHPQGDLKVAVHSFTLPQRCHIRALEVVNDSTAWFAANRGIWGYTKNAGQSWKIDSLKVDTIYPQFRAIACIRDSVTMLLSVGSPALLFRSQNHGRSWEIVYRNDHPEVFFDCLQFQSGEYGLALGDPIRGCFQLIETRNGGLSWNELSCSGIPVANEGEACFAASNSNLKILGDMFGSLRVEGLPGFFIPLTKASRLRHLRHLFLRVKK